MATATETHLDDAIRKTASDIEVTGVVARVEAAEGGFEWVGATGDLTTDKPFFIASTTKLYTSAIVLKLARTGDLSLDTPVMEVLDGLEGLHVYKGTDYTPRITVRHLMSQTSGLPDYFQGKLHGGTSLEKSLRNGEDRAWDLGFVLETARRMGAAFPPGSPKKALYSDTNFQLLGRVIEIVDDRPYVDSLQHHVFGPLGLRSTWLYVDPTDDRAAVLRDGPRPFPIPLAMTSFGSDGGVVASVSDLMVFLRAFFEGGLFPETIIPKLMVFNRIFYPLQYGLGISRFRLPRVLSPFATPPDLVGHSGLSGAFAFFDREKRIYLAGTVNNVDKPSRSFRMMLNMLRAF